MLVHRPVKEMTWHAYPDAAPIAASTGEETVQYLVLCEHWVLCKLPTLQLVLFTTFTA